MSKYAPNNVRLKADDQVTVYPPYVHSSPGNAWPTVTECENFATLRLVLDVTSASGTNPTLDVTLEHAALATGPWSTLGTFAQKTAVSTERKVFGPCQRFVRVKDAITGTNPKFSYSVTGEGV